MGAQLKLLEQLSGESQTVLATRLGVSFVTFNNWRNGKVVPRKGAEIRIAKLLMTYGVSIERDVTTLDIKKTLIRSRQKSEMKLLLRLTKRSDLLDELSLHMTYNSNAIEGSMLSLGDTAKIILHGETILRKTVVEQLEAMNHDKALRFIVRELSFGHHITESLLCEAHRMLMAGIRDDAGQYRTHPVRIVGTFVPTANHLRVPELTRALLTKKVSADEIGFVSQFHADFEKIHPFSDGNGRVGRLVLLAQLLSLNIAPALISKKKGTAYYKALQLAQLKDDYTSLVEYICDAILDGYHLFEE